jgi:acyl-CoA synthetase (AMP-forming)/AMP-acid ligase II
VGEEIAAFVTSRPAASLAVDELIAHCRSRLAPYKLPRRITVLGALPRTPTGKVIKAHLPPSDRR